MIHSSCGSELFLMTVSLLHTTRTLGLVSSTRTEGLESKSSKNSIVGPHSPPPARYDDHDRPGAVADWGPKSMCCLQ